MAEKSKVIDLVNFGCAEMARFADNLSEDERITAGIGELWSARDLLAHVTEWLRHGAERLLTGNWEGDSAEFEEIDEVNAAITERYRQLSWDELRQTLDRGRKNSLAAVNVLTDEQLNDPEHIKPLNGRAAWRYIVGNAVMHPLAMHLRPWYIQHGQAEYATRLAEDEARLLLDLDNNPAWQSVVVYNLACHYSVLGEKLQALQKLSRALQLNPEMAGFAREDPDLALLHGSAEFEALAPAPV